jgi:hypothetical protein
MILYPRLERSPEIEALANELAAMTVLECRQRRRVSHPRAEYPAVGGAAASIQHLEEIAVKLTDIAEQHGYPEDQSRNTKVDADWAEWLYTNIKSTPHQASYEAMWHFFTVVLVPDLVRWRWGKTRGGEAASDRWVTVKHRGRNTFGRLWMRGMILADTTEADPFKLVKSLGEDELVQIMERPSFAGNKRLSQMSAELLLSVGKANPEVNRASLLREYQKRMLRLGAFLELQSLDSSGLKSLCEELYEKSIRALRLESNRT